MSGTSSNLGFCPLSHFKACLYRRWIQIKRSYISIVISGVACLFFCALSIILSALMRSMMAQKAIPIDFNRYEEEPTSVFIIGDESDPLNASFGNAIKEMFNEEKGFEPNVQYFADQNSLDQELWRLQENSRNEPAVALAFNIMINDTTLTSPMEPGFVVNVFYNGSSGSSKKMTKYQMWGSVIATRALWKATHDKDDLSTDFQWVPVKLLRRLADTIYGILGPMLITMGILSLLPLLISQPITDIRGEVRQYMVSCTLKIFPYWLANFIVDFALWTIIVTLIWILMIAVQTRAFLDNLFSTWYCLVFTGPSFLLFTYACTFIFSSPESASRQCFLLFVIILLIPVIIDIVQGDYSGGKGWLNGIYSIFPHILLMRVTGPILTRIGTMSNSLDYYWTLETTQPPLIMMWVDIVLYSFILFLIEHYRVTVQRKAAARSFGDYGDFFKNEKAKHPVTQEAKDMEDLVHNDTNWAVRIKDVSRLFMNTAGKPIPAVNDVSLGIREGSLFGFLGANGAGKTTLIRMITSMLPVSGGQIEIFGTPVEEIKDPTLLSICPQFNSHLCNELTPLEHFKLYSLLFSLDPEVAKERTDHLMNSLELVDLKDKPIHELSGGDVRKLAIALCFLGPAKIILLDEPTASLDPVARHHVQEMILSFKGEKTFMLCTHLLSEAEFLCDTISIMIKGCVYTVGSPQYLSAKFGTEFKIDIALKDISQEESDKCDDFFAKELPTATLSIMRPKARIYSMPASDITLPKLFNVMEKGKNGDNGFDYYTCSSSSLERVFMEIVHMSENDDVIVPLANQNEDEETKVIKDKVAPQEIQDSRENMTNEENSSLSEMSTDSAEESYEHNVDSQPNDVFSV